MFDSLPFDYFLNNKGRYKVTNSEKKEEEAERYRQHPIYGTDFSKRPGRLLHEMRNELTTLRGRIYDLKNGHPYTEERVDYLEGYFTTGIMAIYNTIKDLEELEIMDDDHARGKSYQFKPRGIGLESRLSCFVCEAKLRNLEANEYMNNISGFVKSKEEGEMLCQWFKGARLDYRLSEPNWIQLKIGACDKHLDNLDKLNKTTSQYGLIRQMDIEEAINLK